MSKPFTPRAYQHQAIEHMLATPRNALWAGMGLGKTVSTLTALDNSALYEPDVFPALVIAPLRVAKSTWPAEVRKWEHLEHLKVSPIVGDQRQRKTAMQRGFDVYTTNYEQLPWLIERYGTGWPFATVIADESTKLKGFRLRQGGERTRSLGTVAHTRVKRFVNLTGTPAPNGLIDLWGQTWFLDQGQRLGRSFAAFRDRWFRPMRVGDSPHAVRYIPHDHAHEEIQHKLRDICLTIDPRDHFDLREPIVTPVRVEMPVAIRQTYEAFERELFMELDGHEIDAFSAAARTAKCLQLASGAVWADSKAGTWAHAHDAKIEALADIVEEAAGMPVLVRYHWVPSRERILRAFPQARHLDDNPQTEADWNAGKIPVLVAHAQSCGHGLNLQDGGNIYVAFDHWWDLEHHQQITERIGPVRQLQSGHDRPVYHYYIIVDKTLDDAVLDRYQGKAETQQLLLDYMKRKNHV